MSRPPEALPGAALPARPGGGVREFHYRIAAPAPGYFPGHHRSPRGESGFEFRGHASLLDAPDPRRLDMHASLRDPFGNWIVRVYSQRKSIPVTVVADLSASMAFAGRHRKLDVLADFTESLAWSAWRTGDSFGFIGCDSRVQPAFLRLQTRLRGAGQLLARELRALAPEGRSAEGLAQAYQHLSRQRSLVFLVSDFHFPEAQIAAVLESLAAHQTVPVVIWDALETTPYAGRGLTPVQDAESGRRGLVWWRPALREQWQARWAARREMLERVFGAHRLDPLMLENGFDADAVTRHFHS